MMWLVAGFVGRLADNALWIVALVCGGCERDKARRPNKLASPCLALLCLAYALPCVGGVWCVICDCVRWARACQWAERLSTGI